MDDHGQESRTGADAPASMKTYAAYWRRRRDQERELCKAAAAQATADARRIAALLQGRYGVSRVLLFGSLARGRFTPESDIDLAVAGLPDADFYAALADVNDYTRHWVDLKPLDAVHPHFRRRILETGIDLLNGSAASASPEDESGGDECVSYPPQH